MINIDLYKVQHASFFFSFYSFFLYLRRRNVLLSFAFLIRASLFLPLFIMRQP